MRVRDLVKPLMFSTLNTQFKTYAAAKNPELLSNFNLFPNGNIACVAYKSDFGGLVASDLLEEYKDDITTIVQVIELKYFNNWVRLAELELTKYNPLFNVESHEEKVITTDYGKTVNGTTSGTGSQTNNVGAREVTNQQYGYNDNTPQNNTKDISSAASDSISSISGGTSSEIASGQDKVIEIYDRGGNIGTTMSQQLFIAQQKLLENWNFIDAIFKDINKELSYPIYE